MEPVTGDVIREEAGTPVVEPGHSIEPAEGTLSFPLLDRKQIKKKVEMVSRLIQEPGCHLAHIADTYKQTGNAGHYELVVAVLCTLDIIEELVDNLYKQV